MMAKSRTAGRLLLAVFLMMASFWTVSGPAEASGTCGPQGGPYCHYQPYYWDQDQYQTGYCGITQGTYVKSVQWILWVDGKLSSRSDVDGIMGAHTDAAIRSWQSQHGLKADGCFGYNSWYRARRGSDSVYTGSNTYYYPHMDHIYNSGNEVWNYKEGAHTTLGKQYIWYAEFWEVNDECINTSASYTGCYLS